MGVSNRATFVTFVCAVYDVGGAKEAVAVEAVEGLIWLYGISLAVGA